MIDLLDIKADPSFSEKMKNNWWLIVIALVALAGVIALFVWRKRKRQQANK